jgi:hypothetical protein
LFDAAIRLWINAGISSEQANSLHNVDIQFDELGGELLGLASSHQIILDATAAGHGWFVDPTPERAEEFERVGDLLRARSSPAAGRMDLLTALAHELGHVLGLADLDSHDDPADIMAHTLETGTRRLPWSAAVDRLFAEVE